MIKLCPKCKVEKSDSEFNRRYQGRALSSYCKECSRAVSRAFNAALPKKGTRNGGWGGKRKKKTPEEIFDTGYQIDAKSGCWLWTGLLTSSGYGKIGWHIIAHRFSYERFNGPIPDGMFVCHSCDTPACVNPAHLWIGTTDDNMADMAAKKRSAHGARHSKSIPVDVVLTAYEAMSEGMPTTRAAKEFGLSETMAWMVKRRKTWHFAEPAAHV